MNKTMIHSLLDQLHPGRDPDPHAVDVLYRLRDELPRLPERFECSMLYEREEWEAIDTGEHKNIGRMLSRIANLPGSPIQPDGFTPARHNRYRRK